MRVSWVGSYVTDFFGVFEKVTDSCTQNYELLVLDARVGVGLVGGQGDVCASVNFLAAAVATNDSPTSSTGLALPPLSPTSIDDGRKRAVVDASW